MKFQQVNFTDELRQKIQNTEMKLKEYTESLLKEYKPTFAKKGFVFDTGFHQEGKRSIYAWIQFFGLNCNC